MDFRVIVTDQAIEDLRSITSFLAKNDRVAAREFGEKLINKALTLAKFPERGRVVPEINESTFREISLRPYRIIYEVDKIHDEVYIVRFWHSSRGEPII